MTLSTHAIIGAGVGVLLPTNHWMIFAIAFASHFAIDSIPHWDYHLLSLEKDKTDPLKNDIKINKLFLRDSIKILIDAMVGTSIAIIFFHYYLGVSLPLILAGLIGGLLPDALQFAYFKFGRKSLLFMQKTHLAIHSRNVFLKQNSLLGVPIQIAFVILYLVYIRF